MIGRLMVLAQFAASVTAVVLAVSALVGFIASYCATRFADVHYPYVATTYHEVA